MLLVDRSILEHSLKTEQIIAIRWGMSTLQRDRFMANSPQLGGGKRTGNNGHSVLDWLPRTICRSEAPVKRVVTCLVPVTVSARISAETKAAHTFKLLVKLSLQRLRFGVQRALRRNRRRVFEGSRSNDPFKDALAIRRSNWQLTTKRSGSVLRLTLARTQKEEFTCSVCTIGF